MCLLGHAGDEDAEDEDAEDEDACLGPEVPILLTEAPQHSVQLDESGKVPSSPPWSAIKCPEDLKELYYFEHDTNTLSFYRDTVYEEVDHPFAAQEQETLLGLAEAPSQGINSQDPLRENWTPWAASKNDMEEFDQMLLANTTPQDLIKKLN